MDDPVYAGDSGEYPCWPEALETCRLPDALAAEAYEQAAPRHRAGIKTNLALLHTLFGETPREVHVLRDDPLRGFRSRRCQESVGQVLAVVTPGYAAAPRLAAALMPAILAGVPLTALACLGGRPSPEVLLAAELSGIEDVFVPDAKTMPLLLQELRRHPSRLLLFHQGELDALKAAAAPDIPVWEERRPPRLLVLEGTGERPAASHPLFHQPDPDAIRWGHPDAVVHCCAALPEQFRPDAIFCPPALEAMALQAANLVLLPAMEGCWLHPGLTPGFFQRTRHSLAPARLA